MDWFGVRASPHDPASKCAFCQDKRINPFDDDSTTVLRYKTTTCRHRVCAHCEADLVGARQSCPLCKSSIGQLKSKAPEYLALDSLNQIRKQVFEVYNLDLQRDFAGEEHKYAQFVEQREDVVFAWQRAEMCLNLDERKQMLGQVERDKTEFIAKYKDVIERNSARIEDQRRVTMNEIRVMREEMKRNKDEMRREKEREEEDKLLLLANKNASRLGLHVAATTTTKTAAAAPAEDSRLVVPDVDILAAIPRAPPVLVKRAKQTSQSQVLVNGALASLHRAGGKRDVDARSRTREEMRAGWADLCGGGGALLVTKDGGAAPMDCVS